jgi:L-threonylcarbamoyladenylate synthase
MVKQADKQATQFHTRLLSADEAGLTSAVDLLLQGLPVALPTETVYGLAADATNGLAVAGIYAAKGRPHFNPLIVHVPDLAAADQLVIIDQPLRILAETFWPGPLTLVAPARPDNGIAALVSAGLPTLAVRIPSHPLMQNILRACAKPLAAPSANASGSLSPTRAAHVLASLDGRIAAILDGGKCAQGLESTIVGLDNGKPILLRSGALSREEIEAVLQLQVGLASSEKIISPGQMLQHYAPRKPLRLNATEPDKDEIFIGFGDVFGNITLSARGDLREAAANLFDVLFEADQMPGQRICIAPVPETGLGVAINDRLSRAVSV